MICVDVDLITPCLKDAVTGEMVDTEVIRIRRKSFLRKYNKKNGWYVSWEKLANDHEIYALVIHGTVESARQIEEVYTYEWTEEEV